MTLEGLKEELVETFPNMEVKAPGSIRVSSKRSMGSGLYYDPGDGYLVINTVAGSFYPTQAAAVAAEISQLIEVANYIKEIENDVR
jgi:hypothetical protein